MSYQYLTNFLSIAGIVFGGLFVLTKWIDARGREVKKNRLDAIEKLARLSEITFESGSQKDILILEELLSAIYEKPLTTAEIKVLCNAESPKLALDTYTQHKQFLAVRNGSICYKSEPIRKFSIFGLQIPISVHNLKHVIGAVVSIVFTAIPSTLILYYLRVIENSNQVQLNVTAIAMMSMLFLLAIVLFSIALWMFSRIVDLPGRNELQIAFGELFTNVNVNKNQEKPNDEFDADT